MASSKRQFQVLRDQQHAADERRDRAEWLDRRLDRIRKDAKPKEVKP